MSMSTPTSLPHVATLATARPAVLANVAEWHDRIATLASRRGDPKLTARHLALRDRLYLALAYPAPRRI